MIARIQGRLSRQVTDYRDAIGGFGHNARRYLFSGFMQAAGGGMLATVFAIYIKAAGMSESVVGSIEASVALSAALVCLFGTPLIQAFGYRILMVAALVLIVGARIGQAAMPVVGAVIVLAFAVGLGDGFMRAIGSAFMAESSRPEERAHLFSVDFLARVAATFAGGLLGGLLPTLLGPLTGEVASYQWTIVAGAVLFGAGIVPMLSISDAHRERSSVMGAYAGSIRALRSWRRLGRLIVPQAAIALGGGMVIPFVPLYLKHSLHASIGQIGVILGFSSIVTAVGALGTPAIAKRFGLPTGVAIMQGLSVPFLATVSLATSLPVAIAALWTRGAFMNMAGPMYNQLSMEDLSDADKPVVAGWMFFALNMMWLLGNLLGGFMMQTSYTLPYVFAVALYATGATLTYVFWRGWRPSVADAIEGVDALPEAA